MLILLNKISTELMLMSLTLAHAAQDKMTAPMTTAWADCYCRDAIVRVTAAETELSLE